MLKEEGPRAFYRGYSAYIFAIIFWVSALPAGSDFAANIVPYLT